MPGSGAESCKLAVGTGASGVMGERGWGREGSEVGSKLCPRERKEIGRNIKEKDGGMGERKGIERDVWRERGKNGRKGKMGAKAEGET